MLSLCLCLLAFVVCYLAGCRSLMKGLAAVFGVGYIYGITRANVPETFSHLIFDSAVVGLYASQLFFQLSPEQEYRIRSLKLWTELLIAWPVLLFFIPLQDVMVQLVGLRGNIFFIPFLLFGARLKSEERYRLAIWVAALNLMVFGVAIAEIFVSVPAFFPRNKVTELIYLSRDIANYTAYRIPATFANAHSYGGTMTMTLPLLIGALIQKRKQNWHLYLLMVALAASLLGVLMSGARVHFVVAAMIVIVGSFSIRTRFGYGLGWLALLGCIAWIVSGEGRLQRFAELRDPNIVAERVSWSVNMGFVEAAADYPLGNGLGGGGTSMPYFLEGRVRHPLPIENEYARVMLEQGLVGLFFWAAFITWLFTRRFNTRADPWWIGRRLAWWATAAYFTFALMGTGTLTSIPQSSLFLLCAGWIAVEPSTVDLFNVLNSQTRIHRAEQTLTEHYI